MRHSPIKSIQVAGKQVGLVLQGGYCAEHEWGTDSMKAAVGTNTDILSAERYVIKNYDNVYRGTRGNVKWIAIGDVPTNSSNSDDANTINIEGLVKHSAVSGKGVQAAWCSDYLFIRYTQVPNQSEEQKLEAEAFHVLFRAIKDRKELFLMPSGGKNPFGRSGLTLLPWEHVAQEHRDSITNELEAAKHLKDTAAPIQKMLQERLKKTKTTLYLEWCVRQRCMYYSNDNLRERRWYAMSPAMLSPADMTKRNTQYPVQFFLNPHDQRVFDCGWYTVEELLQWADGEGPVVTGSTGYQLWQVAIGQATHTPAYFAMCPKCKHIYHDGNARDKPAMLTGESGGWTSQPINKLVNCPSCGTPGADFIFPKKEA